MGSKNKEQCQKRQHKIVNANMYILYKMANSFVCLSVIPHQMYRQDKLNNNEGEIFGFLSFLRIWLQAERQYRNAAPLIDVHLYLFDENKR